MTRHTLIGVSLILLAIAADAGCVGKDQVDVFSKKAQTDPELTREQARAALLKLVSIRIITGGEGDPIVLDLKSGAVARTNDSVVTIGSFFSCSLKEKTWRMSVSNPRMHFAGDANGNFEFQSDGTWRAIQKGWLHNVGGRVARVEDSLWHRARRSLSA
jgi:hypothetical protein